MQTERNLIVSKFLEQVLHLLHEVGIRVVFRFLLLRRCSHLTSTWLGPCLQMDNILKIFLENQAMHCICSPVVEQGLSCTEELLASWVSGFLLLLLSHRRLSLLLDSSAQTYDRKAFFLIKSFSHTKDVEKHYLVTSLFRFRNTGAPSITLPVLT